MSKTRNEEIPAETMKKENKRKKTAYFYQYHVLLHNYSDQCTYTYALSLCKSKIKFWYIMFEHFF